MREIQGVTPTTDITLVSGKNKNVIGNASINTGAQLSDELQSGLQSYNYQATDQEITRSLERVKKALKETNTTVQLEWNKDIDRVVMKVISKDTGELVKQIPPQNFIDREVEYIRLIGLLVDKKA